MSTLEPIYLETGNPANGPASYTRFILPFKYSNNTVNRKNGEYLRWVQEVTLEEAGLRKQYFTSEMSAVLFERARWFKLFNNDQEGKPFSNSFVLKLKSGSKNVAMNPPALVLFEGDNLLTASADNLLTGFLFVELYFESENVTLDDLIMLNERFRYKEKIFDEHETSDIKPLFVNGARCLRHEKDRAENQSLYDFWHYLLLQPLTLKDSKENISLIEPQESVQSKRPENPVTNWDIYADSRTFVWTCAVIKDGGQALQKRFEPGSKEKLEAHRYGHWIELLNVDYFHSDTLLDRHRARDFEYEWAEERTYKRWEEWGTFYGFSYHSGAALVPPFTNPPFCQHWRMMYFDMLLLLFYLRVTLFRFSNQLTKISSQARGEGKSKIETWCEKFEDLRWDFALFTNLYQFPLISNQQQGLELYSLARKCLDVEDLYKEIHAEIQSSHEFLQQRQQADQNKGVFFLTMVAAIGLAISVALAFLPTQLAQKMGEWLYGIGQGWRLFGIATVIALMILLILGKVATRFFQKGLKGFFTLQINSGRDHK